MATDGADSGADEGAGRDRMVCLGRIKDAWGLQGGVRVTSYTEDPLDIAAYGPLSDEAGSRAFTLRPVRLAKGAVLARIDGIGDRNAAEALKGVRLFVPRSVLPATETEDEFYHEDLIGLAVELADGSVLGRVISVQTFGAGEMLEVQRAKGGSVLVPFTRAVVPVVDLAGGRVVLDPPPGLLDGPSAPEQGEDA
jgi:16S rRNA processing protein RimM